MTDEELDYDYVVNSVLSNADRFLENRVTGKLKSWHLILFITTGIMISRKEYIP